MLQVLHLSDLHLGPAGDIPTGDHKAKIVPVEDRRNRRARIRSSLEHLSAQLGDSKLDAIVITGDVSFRGTEDGFTELSALLEGLGSAKPANDHILVVPGNHDVIWGTAAGSEERYRHFVTHIRNEGYRTPLLEGIDIDVAQGMDLLPSAHDPILDLGSVLLVGINSSNYCGVDQETNVLRPEDLEELGGKASAVPDSLEGRLWKELQGLLRHDACLISEGQIIALKRRLPVPDTSDPWRLRVATLHHHLLPVSLVEEVKPFEGMINLGQFREFLNSQDIRAVLHGHKHVSKTYLDLPSAEHDIRADLRLSTPPILVSSVATVWTATDPEACRLVTIDDDHPSLRYVRVLSVPALGVEGPTPVKFQEVGTAALLREYIPSGIHVFEGASLDDVYEQLLREFPGNTDTVPNVVCRIRDGATALKAPRSLPDPPNEDKVKWFDDTIEWWQRADPKLVYPQFNHGERIRNFRHDRIDQLQRAIAVLERDRESTRAVVVLFDPPAALEHKLPQPAFCIIQFRVITGRKR